MPNRASRDSHVGSRVIERLDRRIWSISVSAVYCGLGLAYFFRWGSLVRHVPSQWIAPGDLLSTYAAAIAFSHGHFSAIYQSGGGFLAYPGVLIALAPFTAISTGSFVQIGLNHHLMAHPQVVFFDHFSNLTYLGPTVSQGKEVVFHPHAFIPLAIVAVVMSCTALFACDALAERLQVSRSRRIVLVVAEAVVLWNVTVFWGHPEDALAVALAVYALLFAMDERFTGAGWLFGAAFAVQPLVLMMFPILLVMGGKRRALGLLARGVAPAAIVTVGPLAADVHDTVHTLVTQPAFPYLKDNHETPWTFLASRLGGSGVYTTIGGGPIRVAVLALASALAWWARRWRERPEMIAWAVAVALALRLYLETVLTAYYLWPALAVGLVVAARCSRRRFGISIAIALLTTIVAQWHFGWFPWWVVDVAGVTGLLVAASRPEPVAPLEPRVEPERARTPAVTPGRQGSSTAKKKKRKTARTDRKRSARR
jgi:hypothetical protein